MNRNWYAIYTKSHCEKKVAALLSKKEIENYFPVNRIVDFQDNRKKTAYELLFPTIVFVYINDAEMAVIRRTTFVINFVYWLGTPAIIKNDEMVNMQYFTTEYSNVKLEKITVNPSEPGKVTTEPHINTNGQLVSVKKNTFIKLLLPSLGYMMVAEVGILTVNAFNDSFERSKLVS